MRGKDRQGAALGVGLAVVFCLGGAAPPEPSAAKPPAAAGARTCEDQSPRALAGVAWLQGNESKVTNVTPQTISYHGRSQPLHLCSVHFHCGIENFQGCLGQSVSPTEGPETCLPPAPGRWIEVHRAYSTDSRCVGKVSECCHGDLAVVLGYHATLVQGGSPGLPLYRNAPFAEWSGSSTGPGRGCKSPAQWSFSLGCEYRVFVNQLNGVPGEGTRPLQEDVSNDLTRVRPGS